MAICIVGAAEMNQHLPDFVRVGAPADPGDYLWALDPQSDVDGEALAEVWKQATAAEADLVLFDGEGYATPGALQCLQHTCSRQNEYGAATGKEMFARMREAGEYNAFPSLMLVRAQSLPDVTQLGEDGASLSLLARAQKALHVRRMVCRRPLAARLEPNCEKVVDLLRSALTAQRLAEADDSAAGEAFRAYRDQLTDAARRIVLSLSEAEAERVWVLVEAEPQLADLGWWQMICKSESVDQVKWMDTWRYMRYLDADSVARRSKQQEILDEQVLQFRKRPFRRRVKEWLRHEPFVSVIIPVYNVEQYLAQVLDRVLSDALEKIEVICVNDGSTDSSAKILAEYAARDRRVIVVNQENQGQGVARNHALEVAKGRYIYFLDSDDLITPNALCAMYRYAEERAVDLLLVDGVNFFEAGARQAEHILWWHREFKHRKSYRTVTPGQELFHKLLRDHGYNSSVCQLFLRRDLMNAEGLRFPVGMIHEDIIFVATTMLRAKRVSHENLCIYLRRIRPGSTQQTRQDVKHLQGFVRAVHSLEALRDASDAETAADVEKLIRTYRHDAAQYTVRLSEEELNTAIDVCEEAGISLRDPAAGWLDAFDLAKRRGDAKY